jgi:hypothetical protein
MTTAVANRTMTALRLVLGAVVLQQACFFVFAAGSAKAFGRTGLPDALRLTLGWVEILAAILFLAPWTVALGACGLAVVFVVAAGVHVWHGDFNVGGLIVYLAAAVAVFAHRLSTGTEGRTRP